MELSFSSIRNYEFLYSSGFKADEIVGHASVRWSAHDSTWIIVCGGLVFLF